jgi:predicted nucleotidyltransferase
MRQFEHPQLGKDLNDIADALRGRHGCHTAILYGSWAAGDAGPASDYDVAGFRNSPSVERIAGKWRGSYLDLFVYPESRLDSPNSEMLHLRGGLVLFENGDAGNRFLAKLDEVFALGPERLPASELRARRRWAWKMLDRAAKEDSEGNFRRAWLLTALLEDYFHLRHLWYLGPKKSLANLKSNAPEVHSAFEAALLPGATFAAIAKVVEAVSGPRAEETVNDELMGTCPRERSDV